MPREASESKPVVLIVDLAEAPTLERRIDLDRKKARIVTLADYDRFLSQPRIPRYASIGVEPRFRLSRGSIEKPYDRDAFDTMLFYPHERELVEGRWSRLDTMIDGLYALITNR